MSYLDQFLRKLQRECKGSLVRVSEVKAPNAKRYLSQLAQQGRIEKVARGWYWVPDHYEDFFDFLAKEKHFKVLQKQTAASVWNGDFVHRNQFTLAVKDKSYGRALKAFSESRGWPVSIEVKEFKHTEYRKMGRLYVESLEETIVDCVKEWAFTDAFASLHQNYEAIDWDRIFKHYWERIARSNTRVGQVLKSYIASRRDRAPKTRIPDNFIRRQVEEAIEKVRELGYPD